jgi:hypothetical protein
LFDEGPSFMERIEQVVEPVTLPAQNDDDEEQEEQEGAAAVDAARHEERAAEGTRRSSRRAAPHARLDVHDLVSQLDVRLQPNGGLQIIAPPESAAALAGLLEGLAAQLRAHRAASLD